MTLWLIPAGSRGEHEQKFLDKGRVYVAWDGLDVDLGALPDRQGLIRSWRSDSRMRRPRPWRTGLPRSGPLCETWAGATGS